jgi:hypothetical protein
MGAGFFIVFIVLVIVAAVGALLYVTGAGLWGAKTHPHSDGIEGSSEEPPSRRPKHVVKGRPANRRFVGGREATYRKETDGN